MSFPICDVIRRLKLRDASEKRVKNLDLLEKVRSRSNVSTDH
jgi:hypothetical protein